jgi:phosphate-selective porin
LVSAQYIDVTDADEKYKGRGYSLNGEYRMAPKWNLIGRYDSFEMDADSSEKKRALAGFTYEYNHNVEFIVNYLKEGGDALDNSKTRDAVMLTAQVEW